MALKMINSRDEQDDMSARTQLCEQEAFNQQLTVLGRSIEYHD